ncbi:hypothetical protein [Mycoplasma sp. P36-A1]|uniref:hypothetical protein n=1 Tax=Mycoplasma sp. P36-A1 TaxID=3252900 RepID=UPI003C30D5E9
MINNNDGMINQSPNEDYVDSSKIPNDQNACSNVTNDSVPLPNIDDVEPTAGQVSSTVDEIARSKAKSVSKPTFTNTESDLTGDDQLFDSPNDDYVDSSKIPNDQNACSNQTSDSSPIGNINKL